MNLKGLTILIGTVSQLLSLGLAASLFSHNLDENQIAFGESLSFGPHSVKKVGDFKELTDFTVDDFSLLDLHRKLVKISSISNHELVASFYLKNYLQQAGLSVELQQVNENDTASEPRYNVYAYLGNTRDTKVVVTSHLDTVPPYIPYHISGSKICGRGSTDAKASVATQVLTFLSLVKSGQLKEGDASLLFVVGEENGNLGMPSAIDLNVTWDTAIFGEPTENMLGVGHKGVYGFELTAHGKESHSGYPQLGVSASEILIPVLNNLQNLELPEGELLGPSTLNVGKVDIGVASNVLPASGSALVLIRVADDLDKVEELVHSVVDKADNLTFSIFTKSGPTFLDYDVPGFRSIKLAYGTDVPRLTVPLRKRYLYGPGSISVAHASNECVENKSLLDAINDYSTLIKYALNH